ncbi:MAG: nucleoside-diphosphate kinase [bacterium]
MERTLVLIKPDGVERGLVGRIVTMFEQRQIRLVGMKLLNAPREQVETHYAEHRGKGFFEDVVNFLTSGPIVAMALEAPNVIGIVRQMSGATNPKDAAPGTIRGDYSLTIESNVVHTAADSDAAVRELAIWFSPSELL